MSKWANTDNAVIYTVRFVLRNDGVPGKGRPVRRTNIALIPGYTTVADVPKIIATAKGIAVTDVKILTIDPAAQ